MISVSAAFQAAIAAETVKIAELYTLQLADGTVYYKTTHQKDITWDAAGNVYSSVTPMSRQEIGCRYNGEFDEVEVALANVYGDLFESVNLNSLENMIVTIKRIRWDQTFAADEEYIVFLGSVDVRFNRKVLSFTCRPYIDSLNIQVPAHIFQEGCNHRLFSDGCGLTRATYAYEGTCTGFSSRTMIRDVTKLTVWKVLFINGDEDLPIEIGDIITGQSSHRDGTVINVIYLTDSTGAIWFVEQPAPFQDYEQLANADGDSVWADGAQVEDVTYYQNGEVEITGGDNSGQRRPILSNLGPEVTVMWPFVTKIAVGDTYKLYPGCNGTTDICLARFNNPDHFRGFPYIPRYEEAMT